MVGESACMTTAVSSAGTPAVTEASAVAGCVEMWCKMALCDSPGCGFFPERSS